LIGAGDLSIRISNTVFGRMVEFRRVKRCRSRLARRSHVGKPPKGRGGGIVRRRGNRKRGKTSLKEIINIRKRQTHRGGCVNSNKCYEENNNCVVMYTRCRNERKFCGGKMRRDTTNPCRTRGDTDGEPVSQNRVLYFFPKS